MGRTAALHYQGQTYELTVPVPEGPVDERMVAYLEEAFGRETIPPGVLTEWTFPL